MTARSSLLDVDYSAVEAATAATAGADLISSVDWLCGTGSCPLVLDHYLVYHDTDHLTATIVLALAPQLVWAIDHGGSGGSQ